VEEGRDSIRPGRPRLEVDFALILLLRDTEKMGWMRGAEEYRNRTKRWISRDTFKRRYFEAKATKSPWEQTIEKLKRELKTWGAAERGQ
jgi:hypothetical protein